MKKLPHYDGSDKGDSLIMGIAFVLVFTATIFLAFHALA